MIGRKQFCINGHDTFITGRTKDSHCLICHKRSVKKWVNKNHDRFSATAKQWRARNVDKRRKSSWKSYKILNADGDGFTSADYDRLYTLQDGGCAICHKHSTELSAILAVDHDHKTGRARGLLCFSCNSGLGVYEKMADKFRNYLTAV